jgi:hypothetical protein
MTGFQRVQRVQLLGKYKSAHNLMVVVDYDYGTEFTETYTISPKSADSQYQYELHLAHQKCEAVKFKIYDISQVGESYELTNITLKIGMKQGLFKVDKSRRV